MTTTPTLITVIEVARRLDITANDVYRLIDRGTLPAYKGERGRIVIPETALASVDLDH